MKASVSAVLSETYSKQAKANVKTAFTTTTTMTGYLVLGFGTFSCEWGYSIAYKEIMSQVSNGPMKN